MTSPLPRRPAIAAHRALPDRPDRKLRITPPADAAPEAWCRGEAKAGIWMFDNRQMTLMATRTAQKNIESVPSHRGTIEEQMRLASDARG